MFYLTSFKISKLELVVMENISLITSFMILREKIEIILKMGG